jgi:hypothetical protein
MGAHRTITFNFNLLVQALPGMQTSPIDVPWHGPWNNAMYQPLGPASENYGPRPSPPIQSRAERKWWTFPNLFAEHNKEIVIACSLILLPMLGFSVLILGLVFDNNFRLNDCPYPDLCHNVNSLDVLRGRNYYVDFPVGRLAFISSLSATIGFGCVAALMTLYAFITARQFLDAHDVSNGFEDNPSPQDITLIIRLLDAETSLLWEFVTRLFRRITFRPPQRADKTEARKPRVVNACLVVFALCLLGGYVGSTLQRNQLTILQTTYSGRKHISPFSHPGY